MRVVITGGRSYDDKKTLWSALDKIHWERQKITLLVHGACPVGTGGADILAENWAKANEVTYMGIPARFHTGTRGSVEGPLRNQRMLDLVRPELVVAFSGGRGTANCIEEAKKRNIEVILGDLWNE